MSEKESPVEEVTEESKSDAASGVNLNHFYALKAGMTRIFDQKGNHIPVTVVKLIPNFISQVKTVKNDGYSAYQLSYYEKREKLTNNPIKGHLKKASVESNMSLFSEIKTEEVDQSHLGQNLGYGNFEENTKIKVTGTTKGKGFAGVMKRYHFSGGPATHGSKFHRGPGSIGNRATPGRVFKGKKMPGHMGVDKQTIKNLSIVSINEERGYLLIRGSVPGHKNSFIKVSKMVSR